MGAISILIVEDEKDISDLLQQTLQTKGHETHVIAHGTEALQFIQGTSNQVPDLVILDRMLPGNSGVEICKFMRLYKNTKNIPILMLTALTQPEQIVEGLDAGADDYITKPFDMNVLLARVRALIRRSEILRTALPNDNSSIMQLRDLKIDTNQCKVWAADKELELTLSEYKILCAFLKQPGKVLTRNQLVEFIQDGPVHVTDRTIDTHIFGLRKKLGIHAALIETIRGIGYRVVAND
jgi:two-component system, OmpR family, phosphate regulon response regulator PhoB